MAIKFKNVVQAQVTQSLLSTLLERGGYRVAPLGVEELFGEVKYLDLEKYQGLGLPLALRFLPDLLVANRDASQVYLIEVKFRQRFDAGSSRNLHWYLKRQREYWPDAYCVIMTAEPIRAGGTFHQDYIRLLRPGETNLLVDEKLSAIQRWNTLPQLHQVLDQYDALALRNVADLITPALRSLAKLEERE